MIRRFEVKLLSLIFIAGSVVAAQSPPPKKDIPTIAKAAKGAIVTIVMANDDRPIARGTGFLVRADGAVLTNYHVIATGNVGVVKFADGTILPVDGVLATDKFRDLAIIKIHGKTFPTLTLGNSDQIQVGEEVVAIGNPLGLELTVSNGILSGIRTDEKEDGKLLQITAPISRGSSGGPLFNMSGEVVGINALILEGGESLNFAIPINDAQRLLSEKAAKLEDLPNETEPVKSETRHEPIKSETTHAEATPSFSKSSLKDTLRWMQNSLRDEGTSPLPEGGTFSAELTDFSGCSAHFTVRGVDKGGEEWRAEDFLNLNDIDPATVVFDRDSKDKPKTLFGALTTNKRNSVKVLSTTGEHENVSEIAFFFGYPAYGDQFAEAFRHAVNLCGGKPSALPPPPPSYYVRARKGETYIIEYKGHQLTAQCREALAWNRDTDKLGRPMTQNECMYLPDKVGKHFSEDFMVRGDSELRYRPLGSTNTSDVADVLDITDDVLLGAAKHPHPAPKTSPEILKTLQWIQNTLKDDEGKTQYLGADGTFANHVNLITELRGCQVTFVYETWKGEVQKGEEETFHSREQVNLGDLDPTSITSDDSAPEIGGGPVSTVRVHTTDKTKSVNEAVGDRGWEPALVIQTTDLLWELPSPYAERFVKALRHAVTLCGGKASTF
ncbi:MAG: trypsin-like peptidase domain-containing protein [Candidatus Acidiferrum sp.]